MGIGSMKATAQSGHTRTHGHFHNHTNEHPIPDMSQHNMPEENVVLLKNREIQIDPLSNFSSQVSNPYQLMYFEALPNPEAFQNLGIKVLSIVDPRTVYVHLPENMNTFSMNGLVWMGELPAQDKYHNDLKLAFSDSHYATQQVDVLVYLVDDISVETKNQFIQSHNLTIHSNPYLPPHIISVSIPKSKAEELATDNHVSWMVTTPNIVKSGKLFHFCSGAGTVYGHKAEFGSDKKFNLQGSQWPDTDGDGCVSLTYFFENYTPDLPQNRVRSIIEDAFSKWAAVAPLEFTETNQSGLNNSIDILFASGDHGDGDPFDGQGGTLAHAFFPAFGGDCHFDEDEIWSEVTSLTGTHFIVTAIHEFGHSLGLLHSDDNSAIMAPFYTPGLDELTQDDINGIQAIYGAGPCNQGGGYCQSQGSDSNSEWIESITLGSGNNTSGNDGGYADFTGNNPITLTTGGDVSVSLEPGFSSSTYDEYWRIWIDFDNNGTFESNEMVFSDNGTSTINGSFNVPSGLSGSSVMRISMKYNSSADPCEIFQYGEVEDYTIIFEDPAASYCEAKGNDSSFEWIESVKFENTEKVSGNDGGYADFTASTDLSLAIGTSNSVTLIPGFASSSYNEYWRIWIDYNDNGEFESTELVLSKNGNSVVNGTINVPSGIEGTARMRIAMKFNSPPTPCESFAYGEVEDYTVVFEEPVLNYCNSQGNNSSFEWISTVQIGTYINSSGNDNGYLDLTGFNPININSTNPPVTLTPGFSSSSYNEYWRIWIDLNKNGLFENSEIVFSKNGTAQVSGNLTIPSNTNLTTRMRASMKFDSYPTSCEAFQYGEVEDYTVVIGTGAAFSSHEMFSENDNRINTSKIILYPNPVVGRSLTIESPYQDLEYEILDFTGRKVTEGTMEGKRIDISSLKEGNYILRVITIEESINLKFTRK